MNIKDGKNEAVTEATTDIKPAENTKENKSSKKDSNINTLLRKIGFSFLFFLLGALVVGLALYLPAYSNLQKANAELEELRPIESAYEELVSEHEHVTTQRLIYKILANASQMQVALVNEDKDRIDQYFQYMEADLAELSIPDFPDQPKSLQDQLTRVSDNGFKNKQDTLQALQLFQNDLLLLIDNLE